MIQVEHHKTICVGCSVGCGIDVLTRDNSLVRIEGDWDAPVNGGVICKIGRFLPMAKTSASAWPPRWCAKTACSKAATWDEALDAVADHFKPLPVKRQRRSRPGFHPPAG